MNNIKMKCHFSIILEKIWKLLSILLIVIISRINDIIDGFNKTNRIDFQKIIFGFGIFILLFIIILVYNILIWSKTYIWIEDNAIIIERNTLNRKKNTYSIRNISNINLEQNLFERMVGTYLIKIDTNSVSNAKTTDIKIVFSKNKAIEFKNFVMSYMDNADDVNYMENEKDEEFDIVCTKKDIIMHSIYSVPVFSLLIFIGSIIVFIVLVAKIDADTFINFVKITIGGIAALVLTIISSAISLAKGFFNYYGFKAKRNKDMVYLTYGLLKKKKYTIPINKINGVKIVQPLISRIFKKYNVEVINVGIGDEKNESACMIVSCSKDELQHHMSILLPEFGTFEDLKIERQSLGYFLHKIISITIWAAILVIAAITIGYYFKEVSYLMPNIIAAILFVFIVFSYIVSYLTKGLHINKKYLAIADGVFTKTLTIIHYDKMQYLEFTKSPISKITKLNKGTVHILAPILKQTISIPYAKDQIYEEIGNKIIK